MTDRAQDTFYDVTRTVCSKCNRTTPIGVYASSVRICVCGRPEQNGTQATLREPKRSSKDFTSEDLRTLLWANKWCNGELTLEAKGFAIGEPDALIEWAADEIERLRRVIDKLIDAWPNDDIPVEALDGRA